MLLKIKRKYWIRLRKLNYNKRKFVIEIEDLDEEITLEIKLIPLPEKKDYDKNLGILFDYNYNKWPNDTIMAKKVKLTGIANTDSCSIFGCYKIDIYREKEIEEKYKKVEKLFEVK
jgi:hypothetical protein